jgi:hypothetical protein
MISAISVHYGMEGRVWDKKGYIMVARKQKRECLH